MKTATAVGIKEWIYSLTKGVKIGAEAKSGQVYGRANRNFTTVLAEPVTVALDGNDIVELPVGTELVVYRKLSRTPGGGFAHPAGTLAAIFIKDGKRTIEQICIRGNGRISRQRL